MCYHRAIGEMTVTKLLHNLIQLSLPHRNTATVCQLLLVMLAMKLENWSVIAVVWLQGQGDTPILLSQMLLADLEVSFVV